MSGTNFSPENIRDDDDSRVHRSKTRNNFNYVALALNAIQKYFTDALQEVSDRIIKPALRGGFNVNDVRYYGTLANAVAQIPSTMAATVYVTNAQTINANLTVPSNISIVVLKGGSFAIPTGVTLTINGPFEAGRFQVFSGLGAVVFGYKRQVRSEWFGALADATDEYAVITKALAAIATNGGEFWLCGGTHLTNQSIEYPADNITISGDYDAILKAKTGGTFPQPSDNGWVLRCNGYDHCNLFDITIDGNKSGNPVGRTFGLYITSNTSDFLAENVTSQNCPAQGGPPNTDGLGGDGFTIGAAGAVPQGIRLVNCIADGNVRTGFALIEGDNIEVLGGAAINTTGFNLGVGIDIETDSGSSTLRNVKISGVRIANNFGGGIAVVSRLTDDMKNIQIVGCNFSLNGGASSILGNISINSHRQGLIIAGNTINMNYGAGIDLLGSAGVSVSGNNFVGAYSTNERAGILMYGTSSGDVENIAITGNAFAFLQQSAVLFDSGNFGSGNIRSMSICGNTFRDCVGPAGIAATPVVNLASDATRTISYVTITGNTFRDTRGGGAANYAIGITGAGATSNIDTDIILGNPVTGFGAGVPYQGSASAFNLAPTTMNADRVVVTSSTKSIGTPSTAPYWDAANQYLGIGAAGARNLDIQTAVSGGQVSARIGNTSNTAGASAALQIESGGSGGTTNTRESSTTNSHVSLASGSRWTYGRYHVNGHWILAQNSDLTSGTTYAIDIDGSQNVEVSIGRLSVAKEDIAIGTAGKGIIYQAGPRDVSGSAHPEGNVAANAGSTYRRTNGLFYVKASGSGSTGWIPVESYLSRISVTHYGAVGDGVTDDTTAIQAAFTAARLVGGTVFFPPGTYICKSQWNIDEFSVLGSGMGAGSSKQTIIQFAALGTSAAIITRLASTSNYSLSISNMRIEANSWDATLGCRGYGMDLEQRINLDRVMVYGFYKSDIYLHGGVAGGGPYNSVLKNVYAMSSKEHGILVGTGANNITFIEPYCAYNGSPSFGVAPSASSLYDGFHVERDNAGNPGSVYQSYVPESLVILGGNGFANSRYGWYLGQLQNANVTLGYCEANYGAAGDGKQVYLGNDVLYSMVNIPTIAGGVANVEMAASYYRYNNTIWCQGSLLCNSNENYLLSNLKTYLGHTGDPYGAGVTDGAFFLYDNDSGSPTYKQLLMRSFGTAKLIFGGTNHIESDGSNITMPEYFGMGPVSGGFYRNTGDPEGVVTASYGSVFLRTDSTGQVYFKTTSNSFSTGWRQVVVVKSSPTFGDGSGSAFVSIDSGDGNNSDVGFLNAGTELWTLRKKNAISGGATGVGGGQLSFLARKNDQSLSDEPLILDRDPAVGVKTTRDFVITAVGKGLYIKEGTNATSGVATLTAGAVVVSTTKVTASSRIQLTIQSLGTVAAPKAIGVTARTAGTSFTITSADATDTSVIAWVIFEPA